MEHWERHTDLTNLDTDQMQDEISTLQNEMKSLKEGILALALAVENRSPPSASEMRTRRRLKEAMGRMQSVMSMEEMEELAMSIGSFALMVPELANEVMTRSMEYNSTKASAKPSPSSADPP